MFSEERVSEEDESGYLSLLGSKYGGLRFWNKLKMSLNTDNLYFGEIKR